LIGHASDQHNHIKNWKVIGNRCPHPADDQSRLVTKQRRQGKGHVTHVVQSHAQKGAQTGSDQAVAEKQVADHGSARYAGYESLEKLKWKSGLRFFNFLIEQKRFLKSYAINRDKIVINHNY